MTYNLGFFFGPGRPRSLIGPVGSIVGGARFRPGAATPPLRRLSAFGGASELLSVPSPATSGTGVAFDSDDFSAISGGGSEGEGSTRGGVAIGFGVALGFGVAISFGVTSDP